MNGNTIFITILIAIFWGGFADNTRERCANGEGDEELRRNEKAKVALSRCCMVEWM